VHLADYSQILLDKRQEALLEFVSRSRNRDFFRYLAQILQQRVLLLQNALFSDRYQLLVILVQLLGRHLVLLCYLNIFFM